MNPSEILPDRSYRGCNGSAYAVEEVRDGLVRFRTNVRELRSRSIWIALQR